MTTKAQSKPARRKPPSARKTVTHPPAAETAEASTVAASSRRETTKAPSVKAAAASVTEPASSNRPRPGSKLGMVLALLEKPQGASLAKLVEVTGWLPHTTRAALTGLRKRGFSVLSEKSAGGGGSVYRIRAAAA